MKKRHVFKFYLVLLMLIMTACGGSKDAPANTFQEYDSTVQSSDSETEKPEEDVQKNSQDNDSWINDSENNNSEISDSKNNDSDIDDSEIKGSEIHNSDINSPETREPSTDSGDYREEEENGNLPTYGEYYYDLKNVVLYLEVYDELPPNYITKREAQELGWEGGSVEKYQEGAAIGGDYFGNREGLLPKASGRSYTECDIDTNGYSSRGSRRLVFSNDGLYFYTADHYESFSEVIVTEDYEVIW